MKVSNKHPFILLLLLLVGLVIGGVIGEIFKDMIPIIGYGKTIGFPPFTIDLSVMKITLGFLMNINLASIIGLIIAIFIFSRI